MQVLPPDVQTIAGSGAFLRLPQFCEIRPLALQGLTIRLNAQTDENFHAAFTAAAFSKVVYRHPDAGT
jgi:hypothetical protein